MLRGLLGGFARGRRQTSAATLVLDFLAGLNDSRITYSGGANGTRIDSSGVIVAATTPRFDYDPVTLAAKGLLVEEARTNLLRRSQEMATAPWGGIRASISPDATTGPDGLVTADKLVEDTTPTNTHVLEQSVAALPISTTYTFSVYAKAAERTKIDVGWFGGTGFNCSFDLVNGTLGTPSGAGASAAISNAGNGWWRCSVTATTTAAGTGFFDVFLSNGTTTSYTGDGTSGAFLWGAQLEANSFPTSYIPTTSASVTRTADSAVMTGTNFSSWYNQSEGTFVFSGDTVNTANNRFGFSASDGTANNEICHYVTTVTANLINAGGAFQGIAFGGSITANTVWKNALSYASNSLNAALNGSLLTPATPPINLPTVNQLSIGMRGDTTFRLNGHIRSIVFYPSARPGSLQALSS